MSNNNDFLHINTLEPDLFWIKYEYVFEFHVIRRILELVCSFRNFSFRIISYMNWWLCHQKAHGKWIVMEIALQINL